MKKKIVGILICMLMMATVVPAVTCMKNINTHNFSLINTQSTYSDIWIEFQKLLASDGAEGDWFGFSVSIDGDYAIVGAYLDDDNGNKSGSAYIFKRSGTAWTEQTKLLASDGEEGDYFGYSVSIDGDYAIVGAYLDDDNGVSSGSAYVFTRSGTAWTQQAKLLASDREANNRFGRSVSINGDYAIVGAYWDDDNGYASGSAYIFTRSGTSWTEQTKLLASDGETYEQFGHSVSINGDYAIIGAWADDDNGGGSGSAYIFTRSGTSWTEQTKLLASDGTEEDRFGFSVSIDGDYAIVGAYRDDDNGDSSGSAYIFTRSGTSWTEQTKLLASDGEAHDDFGESVSIDGDYAIVGAYLDDDNGVSSGSAYVFTRSGTAWTQQAKLLASDGEVSDWFGSSVSIDGDYAIVGAYYDNDNGLRSGSAYIFKKNQPPNKPSISYKRATNELVIKATDPDGDRIRYGIDWDNDYVVDQWTIFVDSGIEQRIDCTGRTGTVGVIAEDELGAQSDWVSVTSKTKAFNLQLFLQRFFQRFPLFEKILNQII